MLRISNDMIEDPGTKQKLSDKLASVDSLIGNVTTLTTNAKTSVVAAINENVSSLADNTSNQGDLTKLPTTDKSSLVNSIIESVTRRKDLSINVKDFGADATGVNDSTTSIKNAISAITSVGGDVYLPAGSYLVTSTIVIPSKVRLVLNPNALIKITNDFGHVIQLKKDARIMGGEISAALLTTFTHALIYLDGGDKFGNAGHNTSIQGIRLVSNNQQGYGIYFYANGANYCISWVHGFDLIFENFSKAIYFQCVNSGNGNQWINGNQFSKLGFSGNINDIYLDGSKITPNETSGNHFLDIQSEPVANSQYFYVSGNMNKLEGMWWDTQIPTAPYKAILSANSQNTEITGTVNPGAVQDLGFQNRVFSRWNPYTVVPNVTSLPSPISAYRGSMTLVLGNGTSTADIFYICLQSATGTYSWKPIISG